MRSNLYNTLSQFLCDGNEEPCVGKLVDTATSQVDRVCQYNATKNQIVMGMQHFFPSSSHSSSCSWQIKANMTKKRKAMESKMSHTIPNPMMEQKHTSRECHFPIFHMHTVLNKKNVFLITLHLHIKTRGKHFVVLL